MTRLTILFLIGMIFSTSSVLAGGNVQAGKEKSKTCVACHGEDGLSPNTQFPVIAGQYRDYLYQALSDYKAGQRKNPIMTGIVAALSDQDMQDLAAYYASLDGLFAIKLSSE